MLVFQFPRFAFRFDEIILIIKGRNVCFVYQHVSLIMLGKIHKSNINLTRDTLMHISQYNLDEEYVFSNITMVLCWNIYVYTYTTSNIMFGGFFVK